WRQVIKGRPFSRLDDESRRYVCLINDKGIEELGLDTDPVGDYIFVGGRRFLIIGVVETKEVSAMFGGGEPRTEIIVPFQTCQKMAPHRWIRDARAILTSPEAADDAKAEVRFILRTMREQDPEQEDTFVCEVMQSYIDQFNSMAKAITAVAGGVVAVSLLVGGVGIMNIMLVSVSERTREIGLRKAVGAQPAVILLQFLAEAVALCLAGGVIGLTLAQALVLALQSMPDSPLASAVIPAWAVVLSLAFSAGVGVLFGMFPAIKAARLDPIEALRHE
ncbi:MAG: FtsX-like permease family protein, partial [Planctomycetota bacterium]|nr:FtsX-like permease family protein [Planctomycetota bacterium]